MATEAWEPFDQLCDAVKAALDGLKLDFVTWAVLPGNDRLSARNIQIVAATREDTFKSDEQAQIDEQFEAMARAERVEQGRSEAEDIVKQFLKKEGD